MMECRAYALFHCWNLLSYPYTQTLCSASPISPSPFELRNLFSEQEILEISLANCMNYLQVLHRKQDRTERRLSTDNLLTRRKRKQVQQNSRELQRAILIREQEQLILLSNLQACRAKIYVAEAVSSPSTGQITSIPAFTSGSTRCTIPEEAEPTEISWQGWTDDAAMSPFAIRSTYPYFDNHIAPDDASSEQLITEDFNVDATRRPSLPVGSRGLGIIVPNFGNMSPSQTLKSLLSPKADIFEPRTISHVHEHFEKQTGQSDTIPEPISVRLPIEAPGRRVTDSGADDTHLPTPHRFQPLVRNLTWCNNTPQISPIEDRRGCQALVRARTNSM